MVRAYSVAGHAQPFLQQAADVGVVILGMATQPGFVEHRRLDAHDDAVPRQHVGEGGGQGDVGDGRPRGAESVARPVHRLSHDRLGPVLEKAAQPAQPRPRTPCFMRSV